jgi:hypothetical protein
MTDKSDEDPTMYSALSNVSRRVLRGSSLALVGLALIAACNTTSTVNATQDPGVLVVVPATTSQPLPPARFGPDTL